MTVLGGGCLVVTILNRIHFICTSLHGITITEYTSQLIQPVQTTEDRHMDYRPFPRREHMLLYLLANGTKPVVGSGELLQHSICNLYDTCGFLSENAERRHFKIFVDDYEDFEAFNPIPVFDQAI